VQECRIRPALLPEIIDALGINPPLAQLRREGGMDVFVQDEDQRDGRVFPGWYACASRWSSSSISAR
jgi:hypothetical protein